MSKAAMNLQDSFLNQVRRENSEVRVLLVNGTLLRGTVKGFDNFTLILNNRNGQHLIYKHSIAQIVTHRPHNRSEETALPDNSDSSSEDTAHDTPEQTDSAAASLPSKGEGHSAEHKPERTTRSKKDGFNKLDLSQVKLGGEKK